jgi:hypothetical protein
MPALGEAGRRGFIGWGEAAARRAHREAALRDRVRHRDLRRGAHRRERNPGGLAWLGVWVVEAIFWWVAFIKRHELVDLLTFNAARGGEGSTRRDGLADMYYKTRLGQEAMRTVREPVPRRVRRHVAREGMIEAGSARTTARERLLRDAERSLDVESERARAKVGERRGIQNELRGVDSALQSADEARAVNQAAASARGPGSGQDVPALPFAERPAEGARDVQEWRRLLAAGIDPDRFAASTGDEPRELLRRADETERTHRDLVGAPFPPTETSRSRRTWTCERSGGTCASTTPTPSTHSRRPCTATAGRA